MDNIYPE